LAYKGANGQIDLNYALFRLSSPTSKGPEYNNIFDAMTDAICSAMVKLGTSNVSIVVVPESEWPLDGGSVKGIDIRSLKWRRG
jgi:hypothetical protein